MAAVRVLPMPVTPVTLTVRLAAVVFVMVMLPAPIVPVTALSNASVNCVVVAVPAVPLAVAVCNVRFVGGVEASFTVSVNAAEVTPSIVSINVFVVPATVEVLPASVKVPESLLMVTCPYTVTPVGRFATDTV